MLRIAVAVVVVLAAQACGRAESGCVVERVGDGDSIRCGGERVRLLSIDAPELDQGPHGRAARDHLARLLPPGTRVHLEFDVARRDRHGRLLAFVFLEDGRMVNTLLARAGFAVPYAIPPNVLHVEAIRAAADSARADRAGLWAVDAFECRPADHRAGRCRDQAGAPAGMRGAGSGAILVAE